MRKNQVSIRIERFGEAVPESYPKGSQRIEVYCDDHNSIYAALSKAYALAVNELAEHEPICVRTDVYTNEFSGSKGDLEAALPQTFNRFELDSNIQYTDTNKKLREDQLWVWEHMSELLEIIKRCEDKAQLSVALKEKYALTDYQIKKILQTRLDMMTLADYTDNLERLKIEESALDNPEKQAAYRKIKSRKLIKEIDTIKAYFEFVEHIEEITSIIANADSKYDIIEALKNLGISRHHAALFSDYNLSDFSKKAQEQQREQIKYLEDRLSYFSE